MAIFCDAAKMVYGSVVYAIQDGTSVLIFAKGKVDPIMTKTLPMLEFLVAFLAVKCLIIDVF